MNDTSAWASDSHITQAVLWAGWSFCQQHLSILGSWPDALVIEQLALYIKSCLVQGTFLVQAPDSFLVQTLDIFVIQALDTFCAQAPDSRVHGGDCTPLPLRLPSRPGRYQPPKAEDDDLQQEPLPEAPLPVTHSKWLPQWLVRNATKVPRRSLLPDTTSCCSCSSHAMPRQLQQIGKIAVNHAADLCHPAAP